jgi:hypothetical protein
MTAEGVAKAPRRSGEKAPNEEKGGRAAGESAYNPETKGGSGKVTKKEHGNSNQPATPLPTSGRECSA